jgi:hypothetical protein
VRSPLQGGRLLIGLAAAGAALAVGGVASATIPGAGGNYTACVSKTSGVVRLVDPSRRGPSTRRSHCLRGEQRISWKRTGATGRNGATSPRGVPGIAGTLGTTGPAGVPGAAAVSAFSGHIVTVPTTGSGTLGVVFGAPAGVSTSGGTATAVDTLSPSVPITFRNFDASETGPAVPVNDEIDVSVRVNGSPAISCVMSAGTTSCDTGSQSASVPAGSTLSIGVQSNANLGATIFGFDLLFGFEATSS